MKLVKVIWYDAFSDSIWYCQDDIKGAEAIRCESVGYILEENAREIKLCHTMSDTELVMGRLIIPKGMIREIKEILE
jgi:hypothetical protein